MFARLAEESGHVLEKENKKLLRSGGIDASFHPSGFLVLRDPFESLQEPSLDPDTILFHGNSFSFSEPAKKHRKEHQSNLK